MSNLSGVLSVSQTQTLEHDGHPYTVRGLSCSDFCYQWWLPCYPWIDYVNDNDQSRLQIFNDMNCVPCCCCNQVNGLSFLGSTSPLDSSPLD